MTRPSALCLACRSKSAWRQAGTRIAWQAPIRSFGNDAVVADPTKRIQPDPNSVTSQKKAKGWWRVRDEKARKPKPPPGSLLMPTKTRPPQNEPNGPDPRLEKSKAKANKEAAAVAVFKNVVDGTDLKEDGPHSTDSLATIELYKSVATLEEMLSKPDISTGACFDYFHAEIYSQIRRQHARVPRILRDRVGKQLITRVSQDKAADFDAKDLPSVTLISQVFLELGLFAPDAWATLATALLEHICGVSASPQDYTTIESYETSMARRDTLLHDLVGAWKMFNVPPYVGARNSDGPKAPASPRLPSLDRRYKTNDSKRHVTVASLFPHFSHRQLNQGMTVPAAIATYVLLADPINRANRMFRHEIGPFVDAMAAALRHSRPSENELGTMYGQYPALLKYMTERWPAVETTLDEQLRFQDASDEGHEGQTNQQQQTKKIHRQLGQAWNTRNPKVLKRAWEEFWGTNATPSDAKVKLCRENPELFNYFIMAYMAMRQPSRAIEVWNSMASIGIEPTVKSWTSMIDGCKRASNLVGLRNVWVKLLSSNIKLDTAIWTARVSGLIELGSPEEGIAALEEMATIWKANEKLSPAERSPAAVKPTVEPVNAALAGLQRLQRLSPGATSGLLSWAAKQNIAPDIYTFNTLLRPLLRQGLDEEVQAVLKTMQRQNLKADVATFTILLEGALDDIAEQPPQAQVRTVKTFLRNMRDAGVTANMQLYAKMIHLLLQQGNGTEEPVKAVLAHIWGQGLELTSHIYTMLAEHYFTRDPPDSEAVTALIENRRLHDNRDIDRVFWENVIFGYCKVNDIGRAMKIFDKLEKSGSKISLSTLYELLLVLGRSGQTASVARVIDFARKAKDPLDEQMSGGRNRSWHHRFWHLAKDYGFSGEEVRARSADQ